MNARFLVNSAVSPAYMTASCRDCEVFVNRARPGLVGARRQSRPMKLKTPLLLAGLLALPMLFSGCAVVSVALVAMPGYIVAGSAQR